MSDTKTDQSKSVKSESKSLKSSKSMKVNQKKSEVSLSTIVSAIEKDISNLLHDINIRSQRNILMSIQESLKILHKKGNNPYIDLETVDLKINIEHPLGLGKKSQKFLISEDTLQLKEKLKEKDDIIASYESEIKKLKEEIDNNARTVPEFDIKKLSSEEDKHYTMTSKQIIKEPYSDYLGTELKEEKGRIEFLVTQIKSLEEALMTLNDEYNNLSHKYGKLQTECEVLEKTAYDSRKLAIEHKNKFEDLVKINLELKDKLVYLENNYRLNMEELRSLVRKNQHQQKLLEDLETKHKQITAESQFKDNRLKALRIMNSKLETRSKQILQKLDSFSQIEAKTSEFISNNKRLTETIEELDKKLSVERQHNENYKSQIDNLIEERNKFQLEKEEFKHQILKLKQINDELNHKNLEIENKFKRTMEQREVLTNPSNTSINKERKSNYISGVLKEFNRTNTGQGFFTSSLMDIGNEETRTGKMSIHSMGIK